MPTKLQQIPIGLDRPRRVRHPLPRNIRCSPTRRIEHPDHRLVALRKRIRSARPQPDRPHQPIHHIAQKIPILIRTNDHVVPLRVQNQLRQQRIEQLPRVAHIPVLRRHLRHHLLEQPIRGPLDRVLARRRHRLSVPLRQPKRKMRRVFHRRPLHHPHTHRRVIADAHPRILIRAPRRDPDHMQIHLPRVIPAHPRVTAAGPVDHRQPEPVPQHLVRAHRLRHRRILHRRTQLPRRLDTLVQRQRRSLPPLQRPVHRPEDHRRTQRLVQRPNRVAQLRRDPITIQLSHFAHCRPLPYRSALSLHPIPLPLHPGNFP